MTDEQKKNDATRYVVVCLSPSDEVTQVYFDAEGEARRHAEQRAADNPDHTFAVFQKVGSARLEPKVAWKGATA